MIKKLDFDSLIKININKSTFFIDFYLFYSIINH